MTRSAADDESAALVSRASLVIGVDTGLSHMGWAFSVPVIALFGSTCPYRVVPGERGIFFTLSCTAHPAGDGLPLAVRLTACLP